MGSRSVHKLWSSPITSKDRQSATEVPFPRNTTPRIRRGSDVDQYAKFQLQKAITVYQYPSCADSSTVPLQQVAANARWSFLFIFYCCLKRKSLYSRALCHTKNKGIWWLWNSFDWYVDVTGSNCCISDNYQVWDKEVSWQYGRLSLFQW